MDKKWVYFIQLTTHVDDAVGCGKKTAIDNENFPLVLATTELDGVFNPFYSSSATDGSIVGMTQLGLMTTDRMGGIIHREFRYLFQL